MTTKTTRVSSFPLTTQYVPPTTCSTEYYFPTVLPGHTATIVFANGPPIGVSSAKKECWPENFSKVELEQKTWYSPGICPSGFSTASATYVKQTMYAYCCREGYTLLPDQNILPGAGTTIRPEEFTRNGNSNPFCKTSLESNIAITYEDVAGQEFTTDLRKGHSVMHFPVKVQYQMSDFSKFPIDAQPTVTLKEALSDLEPYIKSGLVTYAPKSKSTTSSGVLTESNGSGPDETNPASSELSGSEGDTKTRTTAIAAGVSVSVVIIIAAAGFFFFSWRRKKRRQRDGLFAKGNGPYRRTNNQSQIGGIQDIDDQTGGIAQTEREK